MQLDIRTAAEGVAFTLGGSKTPLPVGQPRWWEERGGRPLPARHESASYAQPPLVKSWPTLPPENPEDWPIAPMGVPPPPEIKEVAPSYKLARWWETGERVAPNPAVAEKPLKWQEHLAASKR